MAEIEVLGGGIFGLSVAYACAKRGARVRLIERHQIGGGASGGTVGALAPHTPDNWNDKKQFQLESLAATAAFWSEIEAKSGISTGYGQCGRLQLIEDETALELARQRVAGAVQFWRGAGEWQVVGARDIEGWSLSPATGFLAFDTLSARISPPLACRSLARAFQAIEGEIVLGRSAGTGADATVLCTGHAGLCELSEELGRPVGGGVKGQSLLYALDRRNLPQVFAQGLHIIPHADGTLAIGSTSEIEWEDPGATDGQLDELHTRAVGILPALRSAPILARWAAIRPRSRRRSPMLGRHPLRRNVFIANGGFKIGYGVAVKAGEVMADLVLDGRADIPAGFSVEANLK